MSNEEDRHTRLDSAFGHGRAAMFIQRYATFIEAGLNYYEVTINKDLDSPSAEEEGARTNNVFINWTI